MEQTKEIRFMPSLAQDKVQIAFIMNVDNKYAKELVKNDIFNYSINPKILKLFLSKWFMKQTILGKRNDFTTNRESAILFGIPVCFIEGVLVGRSYENNK